MAFYFALSHQDVAYQIAALLNCCNRLQKRKSAQSILDGRTNYVIEPYGRWVLGAVGIDRQSYTLTEIKHLVVHPNRRGQGVAKHLLQRALSMIATKMVYATVREDNKSSLKLFESFGFRNSGDYPAKGHRVILLVRASPQWEKTASASKSHWLGDPQFHSSPQNPPLLRSPEPGEGLDRSG